MAIFPGRITFLVNCTFILIVKIGFSSGSSINDTDTLYRNLLRDYNVYTRGVNEQEYPVYVSVMFYLVSINDFDELTGRFSAVAFFKILWGDQRMTWNPAHYNGVRFISIPQKSVWKPSIILGNNRQGVEFLGAKTEDCLVKYNSTGLAIWLPGDLFEFTCIPDVKYYPYDTQTCTAQFIPWGYVKETMSLNLLYHSVNLTVFEQNGVWQLTETTMWIEDTLVFYEALYIQVKLKRGSFFYLINLILPIAGMGFLNIFVFLLPQESGERIGYSITVMLAIAVFQTIASGMLPKSSYPNVATLCFKLLADFAISGIVMIFTIISLRLYNIDSSRLVPRCFSKVANWFLCRRCCLKCKHNRVAKQDDKHKTPGHKNIQDEMISMSEENREQSASHDILEGYTCHKVTWTDVGLFMDGVFAILSLLAFTVSNVGFLIYISNAP